MNQAISKPSSNTLSSHHHCKDVSTLYTHNTKNAIADRKNGFSYHVKVKNCFTTLKFNINISKKLNIILINNIYYVIGMTIRIQIAYHIAGIIHDNMIN